MVSCASCGETGTSRYRVPPAPRGPSHMFTRAAFGAYPVPSAVGLNNREHQNGEMDEEQL